MDPLPEAELHVVTQVRRLGPRGSEADARSRAQYLRRLGFPSWTLRRAVRGVLERVVATALRGGWTHAELLEAVDRVVGPGHRSVIAGLVLSVDPAGNNAFDGNTEGMTVEPPRNLKLADDAELALALRLASLLAALPATVLPNRRRTPPGTSNGSRAAAGKLAQVRALLAKAEATTFPEEAETLSAKAQELISRHSLEELLVHDHQADDDRSSMTYRRLWLDAPYVDAKASLVDQVARTNRCRSVYDPRLGFCTVVGSPFDLDALDLMVTSLLAQAQRAMLAHGSRIDVIGRSRTRSFRQSFLVSFAVHIGQRLQRAADDSVIECGGSSLLPAIRDHEVEVDELTTEMFPHVVSKGAAISNAEGWAGGRAAAELARLSIFDEVNS
jgi:hypothetical protein